MKFGRRGRSPRLPPLSLFARPALRAGSLLKIKIYLWE